LLARAGQARDFRALQAKLRGARAEAATAAAMLIR